MVDAISKVKSSVAEEAMKAGQQMLEWLKNPRNAELVDAFAGSLMQQLHLCIPASKQYKVVQKRRECMWTNYHLLRCSAEYCVIYV